MVEREFYIYLEIFWYLNCMSNNNQQKEKIVIIGYGWVGQANAIALIKMGYQVFYYDIIPPIFRYSAQYSDFYNKIQPLDKPLVEDGPNTWYIISVGDRVNSDGTQDLSLIKKAIESIKGANGKIILRSTILPQHLKELNFDYYLPEFLHEKHAVEESLNPFYFVLGRRKSSISKPKFLSEWELRARKVFIGAPEQAAYIKYLSNIWNAVRIAFVNEFGSLIQEPSNFRSLKEIEKIIDFVFDKKSYSRYGKSFGGHCLPKDLLAFYSIHSKTKAVPIIQAAFESNQLHKKRELFYAHLPEWFSSWIEEYGTTVNFGLLAFLWNKFNAFPLVKNSRARMRFLVAAIGKLIPDRSLEKAREIWDKKAIKNARYFVNTKGAFGKDVNEFDLRESGAADYQKYIFQDPLLAPILNDSERDRVLEIGCGIGRMTEFFRQHFNQVSGVDISNKMIESAKKRLGHLSGIELKVGDGQVLDFLDDYFHLVFSYQTFQHFPTEQVLAKNLRELYRTLKPDGIAKLHLRTGRGPYKWHWAYGASVTPAIINNLAEDIGFRFIKYQIEDSKSLWVWLEKPEISA